MKCAACHSEMVRKRVEIDLRIEGKLNLVRDVIYEECQACGERVLSPEVSKALFEKIKKEDFIEEVIKIPVLEGTYS